MLPGKNTIHPISAGGSNREIGSMETSQRKIITLLGNFSPLKQAGLWAQEANFYRFVSMSSVMHFFFFSGGEEGQQSQVQWSLSLTLLACVGEYFERPLVLDLEQNMCFPRESPCICVSISACSTWHAEMVSSLWTSFPLLSPMSLGPETKMPP